MIRRNLPRLLFIAILLLAGMALLLARADDTMSKDPFSIVGILMMLTYASVGLLLTSRLPSNPIGWLFSAVGIGVLLGGFASEYATYALLTNPGSLPFGAAAAWVSIWAYLSVVAIPLVVLLFPTGTVPTPRWRFLPGVLLGCVGVLAVASMVRPGIIEFSTGSHTTNPLGVASLATVATATTWIGALGFAASSVACVVALGLRFRRAVGDERQQLRWFAWAAAISGICLLLVLVTSIGIPPGEKRLVNDLAFWGFFLSLALGIPAAATVALLKYRLYDLDLVVKKTVVATMTGVVLLSLYLGVLYFTAVGRVSRVVVGLVLLVVTFLPVRRAARSLADRVVYGRRATPYEVLAAFSGRLGETYATDDVLPRLAQVLGQGVGAESARVWLRVGATLRPEASWPTDAALPAAITMSEDELPPIPGEDAVPVRHQGEVLGALSVTMPASDPMTPAKERLVRDLAEQAGLVLRNVRLIDDLRSSRQRLVAAQDEERRKLERNIHDGAQQQLVAIAVKLKLLGTLTTRDPDKAIEMAGQLQKEATDALENLRDLARGIYPPLLADQGLVAALEAQARKAVVTTTVDAVGIGRFGQDVEAAVYFSCLEALQNVAKYAQATRAEIALTNGVGTLTFTVTDDGRGFDPERIGYGTGLQGIADRLAALGGILEVTSASGHGTALRGRLPIGADGVIA